MNILKSKKGITLIALVITIVVLIILATVAIQLSLGDNGIFNRAKTAKGQYQNAQDYEINKTEGMANQIDSYTSGVGSARDGYSHLFIDTSRVLHTITTTNYEKGTTYSYTATEDCAATGQIYGQKGKTNGGAVTVYINDQYVGAVYSGYNTCAAPVNYYVKKGDTIKFITGNGDGLGYISVTIYALK